MLTQALRAYVTSASLSVLPLLKSVKKRSEKHPRNAMKSYSKRYEKLFERYEKSIEKQSVFENNLFFVMPVN
jgi:hypothetical protein